MTDVHPAKEQIAGADAQVPRRLRFAQRCFRLGSEPVLDVGCGDGSHYLQHFPPGSVGLDLFPERALERGLDVRPWNFTEPFPDDLGRFSAVWCSNLLEHALSPHELLIGMRQVLHPTGRVFIAVPATTPVTFGPWRGFRATDHINFFTPLTLRYTLERAGYGVEFLGSPSFSKSRRVASALRSVGPTLLVIGRMNPEFQYPKQAWKRLVDGHIEWKQREL